jgi:hypothetical protein
VGDSLRAGHVQLTLLLSPVIRPQRPNHAPPGRPISSHTTTTIRYSTTRVADEAIPSPPASQQRCNSSYLCIFDLNSVLEKDHVTAVHGQGTNTFRSWLNKLEKVYKFFPMHSKLCIPAWDRNYDVNKSTVDPLQAKRQIPQTKLQKRPAACKCITCRSP